MNKSIYLNYAATSAQKPVNTIQAITDYLQKNEQGASHRGLDPFESERIFFDARCKVAELFHAPNPQHVILTANITTSLNMLLHGFLQEGDHVITSSMEHNAVLRPLYWLENNKNITVSYLVCNANGELDPNAIHDAITPRTRLLILTHASNVIGTYMPIQSLAKIAKEYGLFVIIDTAQTAGAYPLDFRDPNVDVFAFTGHKGLLGLSGTGGFVIKEKAIPLIAPWLVGGTGSQSDLLEQPTSLPDKFEAGTGNTIGALSLTHSINYIQTRGIVAIQEYEQKLTRYFLGHIRELPIHVYSASNDENQAPVISIVDPKQDPAFLSQQLYEQYAIITRSGLHCAPMAHQTIGTEKTGTVRFSFGPFTTLNEIDSAIVALQNLCSS